MFSLPNDFVTNIGTNATGVISALSPVATLVIGVLLATLVLSVIISTISHHK